ncbi:siphovirus ReqiPepy6 Gp37-like family protein [Acetanaerobacterium elongatum]|uniref:Virus ReqiPepy6 Gp37-like protein n=1 Tax=Acetanaerobacterium elongatum TaxID=258515 RepID=A0A1H0EA67_9FIRM|nr:siphovirus ReqiPepy6 Gp37-like family protein [Acetanaerobacterium elongatum]SDN79235.1 virus ReqiPepy6 Gp37-like protein [Acetanaerobacterium elongatum]
MELTIYDSTFTPLGVIDEISSLIWTRRYWSCGEFKLLAPFTEQNSRLLNKGNLLMKKGDSEMAEIRYLSIRKNAYGMEEIEVQGRFLTGWLDKRILLVPILVTDTGQNILRRIVNENLAAPTNTARTVPHLKLEPNPPDLQSSSIYYQGEQYLSCLLACETVAKSAQLGMKIATDIRTGTHLFKVYKGRDLTAGQTVNRPCIFSQEFDNILEQEFTVSTENLRTVAYVGGEETAIAADRVVVEVGVSAGLSRNEVFIRASDIKRSYKQGTTTVTLTLAQYQQLLTARGLKDLEQYKEALSFESNVNVTGSLAYKTDFDVGDRVTCVDKRWGIKTDVRITEITESYQKGKTQITVTFGESLPTLSEKINR